MMFIRIACVLLAVVMIGCNESDVAAPVPYKKSDSTDASNKTSSTEAKLSGLTISPGKLTPAFSPSIYLYSLIVPRGATRMQLNAVGDSKSSSVKVKDLVLKAEDVFEFEYGDGTITVEVTSTNGKTVSYAISLTREAFASDSDLVGIWRTTMTSGATVTKVTMMLTSDHGMVVSNRISTGQPAPNDFYEIVKENWWWDVSDGKFTGMKNFCEYRDQLTGKLSEETWCKAPTTNIWEVNLTGNTWTIIESGQPIEFRRD